MDAVIAGLVGRFERGTLTRRELIQGLTLLAAAGAPGTAAGQTAGAAADTSGISFRGVKIDHVSVQVNDLPRSVEFYRRVFGFAVVSEDKPNEIVRLGVTRPVVSLHHKSPTAIVDHFAIAVDPFKKETVADELKRRGANPEENFDAGFHVKDPDGISVQIMQS